MNGSKHVPFSSCLMPVSPSILVWHAHNAGSLQWGCANENCGFGLFQMSIELCIVVIPVSCGSLVQNVSASIVLKVFNDSYLPLHLSFSLCVCDMVIV